MQDRYAADVGDFVKLGLLRALVDSTKLRLGVNWYLVPDEAHNADGKHVTYLRPDHRRHRELAECDPDLMTRLASVDMTQRSVRALETSGALPVGSLTYSERLFPSMTAAARSTWHEGSLRRLDDLDVVFVDPDNGMTSKQQDSKSNKYVFTTELADYAARGQSVVVYHHADRTANVAVQVSRRLDELSDATSGHALGAVVTRVGSCRFFLVAAATPLRSTLTAALTSYARVWGTCAEFVEYSHS